LEVKRVFKKSWASYRSKAWMKDALKPISGEFVDQFSGWAATLVDRYGCTLVTLEGEIVNEL
jgi:mannosyl-oligosaccharide alpha-1,2-mannosidase